MAEGGGINEKIAAKLCCNKEHKNQEVLGEKPKISIGHFSGINAGDYAAPGCL
jgi:hypothetical protein